MRVLKFLNKEINGLHQAAFFLASASLGAKILAVLRDRLLASGFGAGKALDVYYASFRLPDLIYVFSLFLVSTTALIPVFLKKRENSDDGKVFINGVFTTFFAALVFLIVVSFFALPSLVDIFAPGFSEENATLLVKLSRVLLLSPFLLGLSNLVASVLQSFRRFLAYALSGVLYNVGIIFGLLFFYPRFGIVGVVWGVVLGAALHFLIQVPALFSLGYFPRFVFKIPFKEIGNVVKLSFPRALGLTLNQLVLTVITAIASFLAIGSISVFNLASNLQTIPLGIFALSYSVAAFPSLTSDFIKKEKDNFLSHVVSSFRHIIFWLLPISVLFVVLRAQIVRVVLGAGAFSWTDTRLTAAALSLFSISLFAQGLVLLLTRAFYAASKTKVPLFLNIISSVVIIVFSFIFLYVFKYSFGVQKVFEHFLRVEGVEGVSVLILPLGYSLGAILNFLLLFIFFGRTFGSMFKFIKKDVWQISLVSILMGLVAYFALGVLDNVFDLDTFVGIFMQGFLAGFSALVLGFLLLKFLKNRELEELSRSLKNKFVKKPIVAQPEPEELP